MATLLFVAACRSDPVAAEDKASLRGRFVLKDKPPVEDAALEVDPESRGVANVLVYLRPNRADRGNRVRWTGSKYLVLDEAGFDQRLVGLAVGQTLVIQLRGDVGHHVSLAPPGSVDRSSIIRTVPEQTHEFDRWYPHPIPVNCAVHEHERAYVFVHANRHFAITNQRGEFELTGLPPGEHEFQFWHELSGPLAARDDWKRGRLRVSMQEGEEVDLGAIEIEASDFDAPADK